MDRQFIKLMVESYFNDKNLNSLNLWANRNTCVTELNNEVVTLINNIKLENESFYFELHNLGRGNQQELIYKILDNFIEDYYTPQVNETQNRFNSADEFLASIETNEGIISGLGSVLGSVGNFIYAHPGATGILLLLSLIAAALSLTPGPYRTLSRLGWRTLDKMNDISYRVYKTLKKLSTPSRVKIILYVNILETCMKKCNISNPKDVDAYIGLATSGTITTANIESQRSCLTNCYINWMVQQVGALATAYKQCLVANGSVEKLDAKMIFIQRNIKSECQVLYDLLDEHHKQFTEVVDYLTESHPEIKQDIYEKYNKAINEGIIEASRKQEQLSGYVPPISTNEIKSPDGHRPYPPRDGKGPRPFGKDGQRPFQRQDNRQQVRRFGKDSI